MKKIIKNFWEKYKYDQMKDEDKLAYAFLKKHEWILDLGCGEGRFMALNPKKIKGIDKNNQSIKKAKEKGPKELNSINVRLKRPVLKPDSLMLLWL